MSFNYRHLIATLFILLALAILSTTTTWWVCNVCGMQKYERSIFNTTIDFLSHDAYDEYNTHKKWVQKNGKPHLPHMWVEVKIPERDLLKD